MSWLQERLHHFRITRNLKYSKAHTSFGQYWALSKIESMIFPWIGSTNPDFSDAYNRVKRQIKELEDARNEIPR